MAPEFVQLLGANPAAVGQQHLGAARETALRCEQL